MEKQRILVSIAEEEYPLLIEPGLEETVRLAADKLNRRIKDAANEYSNASMRDILSMVLLEEETELVRLRRGDTGEVREINEEIEALNGKIETYLNGR